MSRDRYVVVFSDVDGTFLDHRTYGASEASGALDRMIAARVPLVFCSSKTRAEIEHLLQRIGISHPFISENGGGVFIPRGYFPFPLAGVRPVSGYDAIDLAQPHARVVDVLYQTARDHRIDIAGFSTWSIDEVARECGMSLLDARLAKLREYDEPFVILDSRPEVRSRLLKALRGRGLRCARGGRFEHAASGADKGSAVSLMTRFFTRAFGPLRTIGLGDGLNDVSLLREVDVPVIVQNPNSGATARLARKVPTAVVTDREGPAGWARAVLTTLAPLVPGLAEAGT